MKTNKELQDISITELLDISIKNLESANKHIQDKNTALKSISNTFDYMIERAKKEW